MAEVILQGTTGDGSVEELVTNWIEEMRKGREDTWGPRMEQVIHNVALTLTLVNRYRGDRPGIPLRPTSIARMLTASRGWREQFLRTGLPPDGSDPLVDEVLKWWREYDSLEPSRREEIIRPVLNLVPAGASRDAGNG